MANWSVTPGGLPVGMAIDTANGRLFIGCRGPQKLIVMSTKNGEVLSDLPIGESVDAIKLLDGQAFVSPEHVQEVAGSVIAHRLAVDPQARFAGLTGVAVVEEIVKTVPVPA